MAINTLVTIRDAIQAFVDGHKQLERVEFGADDKRAPKITESDLFPMLYVAPLDVEVGRAHNTHRLRIYVYERLNDASQDEWENANDTSLMLRDIRVWWNDYGVDDILIEEDPTGTFKTDGELDNVVGYFAEFRFQIPSHGRCDVPINVTPQPPVLGCLPANYVVEYADGTPIQSGEIPSGQSETIVVPNCEPCEPCENATYILTVGGNAVDSGEIGSGQTEEIPIDAFIPTCEDATAVLRDTDNNILSTTPIASGATENITAPDGTVENSTGSYSDTVVSGGTLILPDETINIVDEDGNPLDSITFPVYTDPNIDITSYCPSPADATAVLKDTLGNTLSTTNIPSGTSDDIIAPDGTVNVNKSDSTLISAQTVVSNGTTNYNVADSTAVLKDTAGVTLSTTSIKATESEDIIAPDATYNLDNTSGATLFLGSIASGDNETIIAPDGDVENSDASYTASIESGGTLVLPDSDVNVNGNLEGTVVSVQPIDIDVTDGTNPVTPTSIGIVGNTVTIEVPAGGGAPVGATLMKTGQTTSYRTGDDGDIEAGRATDFFTLASNNPFGNTNRFTSELGTQTYTNNIVIDWSTYDGSTVLGYRRTVTNSKNWNQSIDECLLVSIGTFTSGWRLPNLYELFSITNFNNDNGINYAPFNLGTGTNLWSSTTRPGVSTLALFKNFSILFSNAAKTDALSYIPCRTFTVTGTTLT
jgi:hypothetical protein